MSNLVALIDDLFSRPAGEGRSMALVVLRRGDVLAERYGVRPADATRPALAVTAETTLISWSVAKSILHAAVGVLVEHGVLDVDAPAPVASWLGTDKEAITTLQLLEMRSGLHFNEEYVDAVGADGEVSNCIEMLFGESGPSHAEYAASQPLVHEPGAVWNYSSGTSNIVSRLVGDIVTGSPGGDPDERASAIGRFLSERLFLPAGMHSAKPRFDGAGDFIASSFVDATALDFARFGELYRRGGLTSPEYGSGRRVLPEGWTDHARHQVAVEPSTGLGYGRHWWMWPEFAGSFAGHGYEGQYVVVVPDSEVVLVHLGKTDATAGPALRARLASIISEVR